MPSRIRFALLLAAVLAAAVSCSLWRAIFPTSGLTTRPFNHAAHLERGLDCAICHEGGAKSAKAGMPAKDLCMNCHDEIDKDPKRPVEKKVAWYLTEEGTPLWSYFTRQSAEIRFSHQAHSAKEIACATCHAGIEKNAGLAAPMLQRMDSCVKCHAKDAPSKNECSTCHTRIDRSVPPANHAMLWSNLHGRCSREGRQSATANDCAMCHSTDSCVTCHQTRAPEDHTGAWRFKPHGIASAVDRMRCAVCHESDSCVRCHAEVAPQSHGPGWNAPRDRHCVSCHLPLQTSDGCVVCHRSTPGHDGANRMPAWHTPALDCRGCHSVSLRHPDNGDSCIRCHR